MDGSLTRFVSETSSLPQRSSQLGEQHSIFSYMDQRAPALRCSRPNQSKEVVRVPGTAVFAAHRMDQRERLG